MSNSDRLRATRAHTVINTTSKNQEKEVIRALKIVEHRVSDNFPFLQLFWKPKLLLKDIVRHLRNAFPDIEFSDPFDTSFMIPDGGFLSILDNKGKAYPIVISEVKNQGTNDKRAQEGLKKQASGNAIERLGKNVIGLRTYFLTENIFPFVCFGYGCDFASDSSIRDRVITIGMFGYLNKTYLHNQAQFNRGSYYFRQEHWSIDEMVDIMYKICEGSIYYYFSRYGKDIFEH